MKQQKLDLPIPEREDLDEVRAQIKLVKAQFIEAGWTFSARYRKKQRKFYFTVAITIDEGMGTIVRNPHREATTLLRKYFPEANITSGGGGLSGSYEFTFAERRDRDACDKPKYEWKEWM